MRNRCFQRRPGARRLLRFALIAALALVSSSGCDALFGTKSDDTTGEIFEAGRIEPGLFSEVEYVPLFPFFLRAGDGGLLSAPSDVYFGYDELLYVTDDRGLHVIDRAGRPAAFIPIPGGATSVVQDRRFNVYVTAKRDTVVNDVVWNLPVVMRFADVTAGFPQLDLIVWHPFDDDSRKFNRPDPIPTDEEVEFTGVAILYNNNFYASRRGPVNSETSIILPHNAILEFTFAGVNTLAVPLNPNRQSLRSAISPADVMTFVQPPQRDFFSAEKHLALVQSSGSGDPIRFSVLSIRAIETPDGIVFVPDSEKLQVSANPDRGDGFLYDEFKFDRPTSITFAGDATQYWFVLDAGKDSLFVFTANGIEGVAPPPGARSSKPVVVSFGGTGDGATQFNDPEGVAYGNRIVYVADTGNNRISRFRLNTDFE